MKRLLIIGLIVLACAVDLFGEDIPWGASEEDVDAKYSWLYEFEYSDTFGINMEDFDAEHYPHIGFNVYSAWRVAKDGLFGLSYILSRKDSKSISAQLDYLEERLDELDEMYGKPKTSCDEKSVTYVWTTDRETICVSIYSHVIFVDIDVVEGRWRTAE